MVAVPAVICRTDYKGIPARMAAAVEGELIFARGDALIPALQAAFNAGRPIVSNVAAPIIIRALAPLLGDKHTDPPVVATSIDGYHIVPLLGLSHGAGALARRLAIALDGTPVSFGGTSGHMQSGTPLDDAPPGYTLHNPDDYKQFAVALMDGEPVRIEGHAPWLDSLPQSKDARLTITVTDRMCEGSTTHLVYVAGTLAVGVGCERGTDPAEVARLVERTLTENRLNSTAVACCATIDLKEDEPAIHKLPFSPQRFFTAEELRTQSHRISSPSELVFAEVGTPSVAEAAALAAAGPDAVLIVAKTVGARATCAVARSPTPILDPPGRHRGVVSVVGIGPGGLAQLTSEAESALYIASDWVGYRLYLDLISCIRHERVLHPFPLGEEEARVRHAIELAKQGKRVALICSGDAGIYAMASLVYEIIDKEPCRIAVEVIPGISAFQAAAAKAGAMIGHDFCCISLSDLLTPWDVIERRIRAAAEGDFVVAFYNPRSLKRRDQLERAMAILSAHRPPETPVVIASNLGRKDERVKIVRFDAFDPAEVDMLTLVMVGSSQSKSFKRGDGRTYAYTPRGYANKRAAP